MSRRSAPLSARRAGGFTLIEVMVAILLMALVSLLAWRGFDSLGRADANLQASGEQTAQLLRVLQQLQRDIRLQASVELNEPADPDAIPRAQSSPSTPVPVHVGGGSGAWRLDIVRSAADADGSLQRVRWWLKGDTLYRASSSSGTGYPLPRPKTGVAVLNDLERFDIRAWQPGKGWSRPPASGLDNPAGLEITLAHRSPRGVERYRLVIDRLE